MTCPFCGHREDRVIDSRESKEGDVIRRRRECLKCERRFTTYERSDEIPYMVVKRDGRREKFDRQKVLEGLLKACRKAARGDGQTGGVVDEVESKLADTPDREMSTTEIGELLMTQLTDAGQDRLRPVRVGVPRFSGRGGFSQGTERSVCNGAGNVKFVRQHPFLWKLRVTHCPEKHLLK